MNKSTHVRLSSKALELLRDEIPHSGVIINAEVIAQTADNPDEWDDIEFVIVRGNPDDPHEGGRRFNLWRDTFGHEFRDHNFGSFNHYIDIRKGKGRFDDYDGYSGQSAEAAHHCQGVLAAKAIEEEVPAFSFISGLLKIANRFIDLDEAFSVDKAVMLWGRNQYVHAPGHKWYDYDEVCSPACEKYNREGENSTTRFPAITKDSLLRRIWRFFWRKSKHEGIPWSIFYPVDNMAFYYYDSFLKSREDTPKYNHLGVVLHAAQDAAVPQHSAGVVGNWHDHYEDSFHEEMEQWLDDDAFIQESVAFFDLWKNSDAPIAEPFEYTGLVDCPRNLVPSPDWEIDQLVTWMAFQAYFEYETQGMDQMDDFDGTRVRGSMRELALKALAMSMLVLLKADTEVR
ncbi:MAG: hypothetical protein ACXACI_11735 [Candidatus Hodarchaeales archaeon]|jgi:hypothetical protein